MRRNRISVWVAAICLMLALGIAGAHSHHDHDHEIDLTHECGACILVADLDVGDVPASSAVPATGQKQVISPDLSQALISFELVEEKARDPPINT